MKRRYLNLALICACVIASVSHRSATGKETHGIQSTEAIDKMRDRDLQPERIMDAIKLDKGMIVGEAGAGYGYFTFKMSKRVGSTGIVFANDIDPAVLQNIKDRCRSEKVTNIQTVLGKIDDPMFPNNNLDMVVVFDCLFEFSQPAEWMQNTKKYLKPGGTLVIVDPDPSRFIRSDHFLSKEQIHDLALKSGYALSEVDDSFLKSHMIIVLRPLR